MTKPDTATMLEDAANRIEDIGRYREPLFKHLFKSGTTFDA